MGQVADLPQERRGSSAGAIVPQGSDKQCRLTQQGIRKLEDALEEHFGDRPSDTQVADTFSLDRGTVGRIRNAREAVVRQSIDRLFTALNLDLEDEDYKSIGSKRTQSHTHLPNPFEQSELWGCDDLLRRIFETLRKGGSQALIGPAGCGKSEILRAIGQQGTVTLARSQETFLNINMHWIRDEQGFFEELCTALDCDVTDQNQIRRKLQRQQRSYVLCLDAIHVLTNEAFFPEATRNWLRGMAEMPESPLQLVVTSQKDLRSLFPDNPNRSSPLADFFAGQTIELTYWNLTQIERFVQERLRGTRVMFDRQQIQKIWETTKGKPKEVREMAKSLYDAQVSR